MSGKGAYVLDQRYFGELAQVSARHLLHRGPPSAIGVVAALVCAICDDEVHGVTEACDYGGATEA
eukprot:5746033-Pyramimonas_sp.AAC.1